MLLDGLMRGDTGRETHGMATAQRLDVEESKDLLTFEEFEGRDVSCLFD